MMGVDPRRFGEYASEGYLIEKNEEAYAKVFTVHYPDEEREAARGVRRTPCYDRMKDLGAVFGNVFGWERPNWFAPEGYELGDSRTRQARCHSQPQSSRVADGEADPGEMVIPPIELLRACRGRDSATSPSTSGCRTCRPLQNAASRGRARRNGWAGLLTNFVPKTIGRLCLSYLLTK